MSSVDSCNLVPHILQTELGAVSQSFSLATIIHESPASCPDGLYLLVKSVAPHVIIVFTVVLKEFRTVRLKTD